jgi:hypothetical protein
MKFKEGDYVRISKPLKEYKGLYKLKNRIGKILDLHYKNSYRIYFKEEDCAYLFFGSEINKVSKVEVFMEEI